MYVTFAAQFARFVEFVPYGEREIAPEILRPVVAHVVRHHPRGEILHGIEYVVNLESYVELSFFQHFASQRQTPYLGGHVVSLQREIVVEAITVVRAEIHVFQKVDRNVRTGVQRDRVVVVLERVRRVVVRSARMDGKLIYGRFVAEYA